MFSHSRVWKAIMISSIQPYFSSNTFSTRNKSDSRLNDHSTVLGNPFDEMFDLEPSLGRLAGFLTRQYKSGMPIFMLGVSDGTESYELAAHLISFMRRRFSFKNDSDLLEQLKQKYPIKGFELSSNRVKDAKSGFINLHDTDIGYMRETPGLNELKKFISPTNNRPEKCSGDIVDNSGSPYQSEIKTYKLDRNFAKLVDFEQKDILLPNNLDFIPNKPVVVTLRNIWYQFNPIEGPQLLLRLGQKLKKGSLLVLSKSDVEKSDIEQFRSRPIIDSRLLRESGFEELNDEGDFWIKK